MRHLVANLIIKFNTFSSLYRFGVSDPSPYSVAHRSLFADDLAVESPFLPEGAAFDLSTSTRYNYVIFITYLQA